MYNSKAKPATPLRRSAGQIVICVAFLCGVMYGLVGFSDHIGLLSGHSKVGLGNPKVFQAGLTEEALDKLPKESYNYLAMIDAGSSGCRAHIFRYGLLGSSSGSLYILPKHKSLKVRPGLSSFASNPNKAGESLMGLIEFMKQEVPEAEWAETPIWLKATAGLRMLDETASTAILKSVQDFLGNPQNSPFYFRADFAAIIPGVEEGAFGWISVNYMKKVIGPFREKTTIPNPDTAYAVIEMGGASTQVTQIASSLRDKEAAADDYSYKFNIQGQSFFLYTHSYLGYGADQARHAVNSRLIADFDKSKGASSDTLVDPCLNPGYLKEANKITGDVYTGPDGKFNVVGGGDRKAELCHDLVEQVLFPHRNGVAKAGCAQPTDSMSFNCIYQPKLVRESKNVLIFENFYYAASGMGTLPAGHEPVVDLQAPRKTNFPLKTSPKEYLDSAEEVCGQPWDSMTRSLPRDASPIESNSRWCFAASYAYLFLTHGIGFDDNKVVTVQQNIDGSDIEWALGAAYREAASTLGNHYLRVA